MRLITTADFDGLACGAILRELGIINSWKYVHPDDIHEALTDVTKNDILANIPYAENCGLWFDHHSSEKERLNNEIIYDGASYSAPSTARVVFDNYNGRNRIPHMENLVRAVDKVDSGNLTMEDVLCPSGWVLLGFLLDPLTAVGFHNHVHSFKVNAVLLLEELMDACPDFDIEEILMLPNVAERVEAYRQQCYLYRDMIIANSRVEDDIVITDLRGVDPIYTGNRFMVYNLFPHQRISVWIVDGQEKGFSDFTMGHNILNLTPIINIGHVMLQFSGGGHRRVGSCQVPNEKAEECLAVLIEAVKEGFEALNA